MINSKRNRYPGVNYFTKEEKDIFCGRIEDSKRFYTQVMLSKTLVLHAESGIGKSSLIQAGFLPYLEEIQNEMAINDPNFLKYLPITIRLDVLKKNKNNSGEHTFSENEITTGIIARIKAEIPDIDSIKLPYIEETDTDCLWRMAKKISKEKYKLLLIIDQFEELQGCSFELIEDFKKEIAQLLTNRIPESIYDEIKRATSTFFDNASIDKKIREDFNSNIDFLELPLDVKIVFVVREDKLGTMSLLSDYMPDILKNDFVLKALSKKDAVNALVMPAMVEGDFSSPKFSFESDQLVEKLIDDISDSETGMVDPIQIQIIASKIEETAIQKASANLGTVVITKNDIPLISDVIKEFYQNSWTSAQLKSGLNATEFENKKNEIISVLVVNDRRDLANSGWIIKNQSKATDLLIVADLIKTGLIRKVPSGSDTFYQLCHDRFIPPISEDIKNYELLKEQQKISILNEQLATSKRLNSKIKKLNIVFLAACIICGLILIYNIRLKNDLKNQKTNLEVEKAKSNTAIKALAEEHIRKAQKKLNSGDSLDLNDLYTIQLSFLQAQEALEAGVKELKKDSLSININSQITKLNLLIKQKETSTDNTQK